MRHIHVASLAFAIVAGSLVGTPALAGLAPFEAVRNLQQLQDQIAEGDAIAEAAHAKAMERAAHIFADAPPSSWADPRNARALVIYLLSGGRGPVVEEAMPANAIAPAYRALYTGAVAYGTGDDDRAREVLMPIDARSLPVSLGGQLALVQAALCADGDRAKALALLDLARLLGPGTLIEEAALRKQMSLIGPTGDVGKFAMLARRYLSAFRRSVYADNFREVVAATAMQIGAADSDEAGLRLSRIAAGLDKADRRRLYLAIARAAVLAGHLKMAALSADEARRLSDHADADEARAKVYLGAATITGDRYDVGHKALDEVAPDRLGSKDRALRASAVALADMIRRPTDAVDPKQPEGVRANVVAEAERSLVAADAMLTRAEK